MRIDMVWHRRQEQLPSHRWLRKMIDDVTLRRVWGTRNVPLTRFGGEPMPALIASALRNQAPPLRLGGDTQLGWTT